jgi:hypothetical protein
MVWVLVSLPNLPGLVGPGTRQGVEGPGHPRAAHDSVRAPFIGAAINAPGDAADVAQSITMGQPAAVTARPPGVQLKLAGQ